MTSYYYIAIFIAFTILCGFPAQCQVAEEKLSRKAEMKAEKLQKLVRNIERQGIPGFLKALPGSPAHNPQGPAVLTAAISRNLDRDGALRFVGTLRDSGFRGDLVAGLSLRINQKDYVDAFKEANAIIYDIETVETVGDVIYYKFKNFQIPHSGPMGYSINVLRLYLYKWWVSLYHKDARIMVSDSHDVIFQSNPFNVMPPNMFVKHNMHVFMENFPLKAIHRCPVNNGWLISCYPQEKADVWAQNLISCSGTSFGTRDAILAYVSGVSVTACAAILSNVGDCLVYSDASVFELCSPT